MRWQVQVRLKVLPKRDSKHCYVITFMPIVEWTARRSVAHQPRPKTICGALKASVIAHETTQVVIVKYSVWERIFAFVATLRVFPPPCTGSLLVSDRLLHQYVQMATSVAAMLLPRWVDSR